MSYKGAKRICIVPRVSGVGGMVSFRHKLTAGLAERGVEACDDLADTPYQSVLVIGGTRQLYPLWRARQRGVPVVQRLDGMNWLHRIPARRSGLRHYLRAEVANQLLAWIRSRLATRVVYQSVFAQEWWERACGRTPVPNSVIHNGVDLNFYTPHGTGQPPEDRTRLLMVEGSLAGGYEQGLGVAVDLAQRLQGLYPAVVGDRVELMVVGRVASELMRQWDERIMEGRAKVTINWTGLLPSELIPETDRSAHLFYSSDIHPACPNSVIEALACGLPVVSFDTGALSELVVGDAGKLVPYGGDAWRLEPPDIESLTQASAEVLSHLEQFRRGARERAESAFDLDAMVDAYLQVLQGS